MSDTDVLLGMSLCLNSGGLWRSRFSKSPFSLTLGLGFCLSTFVGRLINLGCSVLGICKSFKPVCRVTFIGSFACSRGGTLAGFA